MKKIRLASAAAVVLLTSGAVTGQNQLTCLHGTAETMAERARRTEALQAVRLVNTAITPPIGRFRAGYPSWEELATLVGTLRTDGGPMGELARKIRWGTSEPLPGWNIHYVAAADAYAFSMRDMTDPCGFSYVSDDRRVIVQGETIEPRTRVIPVETSE
jgi:hypothetical protein